LGTRVVVDAAINTSPFWSEIIIFAHERHPSCVFLNNPVCNHPLAEGTQLLKQNWLHAKWWEARAFKTCWQLQEAKAAIRSGCYRCQTHGLRQTHLARLKRFN